VRQVLRALGVQDQVDADAEQTRLAERFVEVAVQQLSFQAAFGVDAALLRLRASACVCDAVKLLQASGVLKAADALSPPTGWSKPVKYEFVHYC